MNARTALILLTSTITTITFAQPSLIGTNPPEWENLHWLNSSPLKLSDLRGKVVLVRWWTAPDCPYCRATAPSLNEFYRKYQDKGLEVIGIYHHKGVNPLKDEDVMSYAREFNFKFPIAVDIEWKNLRRWWLDGHKQAFTSVSFLIDRHGIVRYIHPGGQYVKGDNDYITIEENIEKLIKEDAE